MKLDEVDIFVFVNGQEVSSASVDAAWQIQEMRRGPFCSLPLKDNRVDIVLMYRPSKSFWRRLLKLAWPP